MSRAPVKNTCPDIDKVIDCVTGARDNLYGLERTMEQLRSDNSALRDWGNDEANRVDELESEQEELRNEIDELKREIERLNSQLERYDN